jgi:hypothetical protein
MDKIKERPIIFSAPMVNAILDGRKTQTRRVINPQPTGKGPYKYHSTWGDFREIPQHKGHKSRYGVVGDRLWVRETTKEDCSGSVSMNRYVADDAPVLYSGCENHELNGSLAQWDYTRPVKPSIFMPRWASRITLEITGIRVERLQDISEEDAIAEGVDGEREAIWRGATWYDKPKRAYRFLFESINGQGSWDANPWVWVIEFKRV